MRLFGTVSGLVALAAMGGFAIAGGNGRGGNGPQGGGHPGMGHNHGGHGQGHGRGHVCPGHAGSGGRGGTGGGGGQGGTGGGAPPPTPCVGSAPPSALITDFSDAVDGNPILFGTPPEITGGTFSYAAPGLTAPVLSLAPGTNGTSALQVAASPGLPTDGGGFFGFGLFFNSCVDASAYNAVQFTINGTLGDCTMRFAVSSSQTVNPDADPRGSCTETSCFPPSAPIGIAGTTVVRFSDFTFPGSPNIVDPTSLLGIQWQMDTPPGVACNASFSIDDIRFVNAPPAPRLSFTFDKDTQGWVLNDFLPAPPAINLALTVPPGGTPTTFGFTAADGDPSPGALAVGVTYTDFDQNVDAIINVFPPVDLSGRTLHARVRLASGSFPIGGLQLHASTGPAFVFAGSFLTADALASGAWVPVELDLGAVTEAGFDPTQVVQVGVQFFSGSPFGGAFPGPESAVFEIDTVTD